MVPAVEIEGLRISSGVIREALAAGHIEEANALLGYPWFVRGEVVHGDKRGRELGYPTANIRLDPACGLRHGIYAVRVGVGERRYDGVASFGRRPMFDVGTVLLEVFLFDFAGDLYGRAIDVAFIGWIRHELKFADVAELVRCMDEDSRRARRPVGAPPGGVSAARNGAGLILGRVARLPRRPPPSHSLPSPAARTATAARVASRRQPMVRPISSPTVSNFGSSQPDCWLRAASSSRACAILCRRVSQPANRRQDGEEQKAAAQDQPGRHPVVAARQPHEGGGAEKNQRQQPARRERSRTRR